MNHLKLLFKISVDFFFDKEKNQFLLQTALSKLLTHSQTVPTLYDPVKEAFRKMVRKGENAGNQHFLLFPQCFLPFTKQISYIHPLLFCRMQMLSVWTSLKYCSLVELNEQCTRLETRVWII